MKKYRFIIKYIVIILFLVVYNFPLKSQWFLHKETQSGLNSVKFITPDVGFIVGREGSILKTTDGGINWVQTTALTSNDLEDIFFINENKGWIAGESGTVLITSDGGENWDSIKTNIQKRFFSIYFVTENDGWIASEDAIFKSSDGGLSWEISKYQETTDYYSVYFANNDTGWVSGDSTTIGVILKTEDGGTNWIKQFVTNNGYLTTVLFIEDSIGYVFGDNDAIIKSTDFGNSWLQLTPAAPSPLFWEGAYFINRNEGWITGWSGNISKTTNGGLDWEPQRSYMGDWLGSIFFTDSVTGWAVGVGFDNLGLLQGEIFKTTNGGVTFIENEIDIEVTEFKLFQNYPNPFNPSTRIQYAVSSPQFASLKVYDVLGNEVAALVNEEKSAGVYEVEFSAEGGSAFSGDAWNLPSGVYFYQLRSGTSVETKKMIILK